MSSALPTNSDIARCYCHVGKVPTSEVAASFDHFIGNREHARWNGQPEGLGGLKVDY
jgi:hypothetical protein